MLTGLLICVGHHYLDRDGEVGHLRPGQRWAPAAIFIPIGGANRNKCTPQARAQHWQYRERFAEREAPQ